MKKLDNYSNNEEQKSSNQLSQQPRQTSKVLYNSKGIKIAEIQQNNLPQFSNNKYRYSQQKQKQLIYEQNERENNSNIQTSIQNKEQQQPEISPKQIKYLNDQMYFFMIRNGTSEFIELLSPFLNNQAVLNALMNPKLTFSESSIVHIAVLNYIKNPFFLEYILATTTMPINTSNFEGYLPWHLLMHFTDDVLFEKLIDLFMKHRPSELNLNHVVVTELYQPVIDTKSNNGLTLLHLVMLKAPSMRKLKIFIDYEYDFSWKVAKESYQQLQILKSQEQLFNKKSLSKVYLVNGLQIQDHPQFVYQPDSINKQIYKNADWEMNQIITCLNRHKNKIATYEECVQIVEKVFRLTRGQALIEFLIIIEMLKRKYQRQKAMLDHQQNKAKRGFQMLCKLSDGKIREIAKYI
eukprot:403336639